MGAEFRDDTEQIDAFLDENHFTVRCGGIDATVCE